MDSILRLPIYDKEYINTGQRWRWNTILYKLRHPFIVFQNRRERAKYGVADWDAISFHSYLEKILANGLNWLAANKHGVPISETADSQILTQEEIAGWGAKMRQMAEDATWLATFDDKDSELHDKYYTDEDGFITVQRGDGMYELKEKRDLPDRDAAWMKELKELDKERELRKDRLMDMLKEHFFSLWD